jgi:hypothetical protein
MAAEKLDKDKVEYVLAKNRETLTRQERLIEALRDKALRIKEEGMVIATNVLATAEVVGAAFGMGFVRGYYGEKAVIFGLPIDAASGLLLHGIAYGLGFTGGKTAHFVAANLHNLANGSLATWAASAGAQLGFKKSADAQQQKEPAPQQQPAPQQLVSGDSFAAFGATPAPAQLPAAQMAWNPWAMAPPGMQANPWGGMPQQSSSPMTQEELAAAMAWQRSAA